MAQAKGGMFSQASCPITDVLDGCECEVLAFSVWSLGLYVFKKTMGAG